MTSPTPPGRTLRPGQRCRIWVHHLAGGPQLVHESTDVLLEAPNWDGDGRLVLNGGGLLWELAVDGSAGPRQIPARALPPVNNDHVLSPDGGDIFASAEDWQIYRLPREGGTAQRITSGRGLHFLHGVSPDGSTLAYVRIDPDAADPATSGRVQLVGSDGREDRPLTTLPGPDDGPEFSPDGAWVYFTTEAFTDTPGHAQIARIRPDGTDLERLTHGAGVDWFPHLSPDGTRATYLTYAAGTRGHPADQSVTLTVVDVADWAAPLATLHLTGGQGTINVNSWAPDSTAFAYVDYPAAPSGVPASGSAVRRI